MPRAEFPLRFWQGLLLLSFGGFVWLGGGAALVEANSELTRLVDSPTAGLVDKGRFGLELRLFAEGGVLGQLEAGVLRRLTIGVAYGGEQIIGHGEVEWYPRLEAGARYRLVEESRAWPALVVGYETQGYGAYADRRYRIKSKGLYACLSKNYLSVLGQFGVHGGVNLTREDADGDGDLSGWVGLDKSFNDELEMVGEYDLGLNDNGERAVGAGKGYLNAGVRWAVAPQLRISFFLKDLLNNGDRDFSRELSVLYSEDF